MEEKYQSIDNFNKWLLDYKNQYEESKKIGTKKSLQQEPKLIVYRALSDLFKCCQIGEIECAWLKDAFVEEFKEVLSKTVLRGASKDILMQFVEVRCVE